MVMISQYTGFLRFSEGNRFSEGVDVSRPESVWPEGRFGLTVMVYDPHTNRLKARYDSDLDENPINSVTFEFVESGCGGCTIKTNEKPENLLISMGDRVDIHLMGSSQPWYSGRITSAPQIDTSDTYTYKGYGLFPEMGRIIVDKTYQDESLRDIVLDLADELAGGPIHFFEDRIMSIGYTVNHVRFDHVSLNDALKKIADLAHHYVFGVDENRAFFFKPIESRPMRYPSAKVSHWVGYAVDGFELKESSDDVINSLYVKIGAINASDSNYADFTVSDLDSIAFFGERGKTVSAPEIKDESDAQLWAEYQLEETAWHTIKGKVRRLDVANWITDKADMLRAEGFLRVSMPRSGLFAPYYEPLNGYFRYQALAQSCDVHGTYKIRRDFTCRISGKLGRIQLMAKRVGDPNGLTIDVKLDSDTLVTATVSADDIPEWFGWVTFDFDPVDVYSGWEYSIEISSTWAESSSHYYIVLVSEYDAPYSGAYYWWIDTEWIEHTDRGILYRAYIVHDDEFILPIKKVKYTADPDGGIYADIDLGGIEQPLENRVLNLLREIKAEQLLQQSNVNDLA